MYRVSYLVLFIGLFLLGCSPSETGIQTAISHTEVAKPTSTFTQELTDTPEPSPTTEPSPTDEPSSTPEPSPTSEPSPTPIVLPDVVFDTFTGITIQYRDSFEFIVDGLPPYGWVSDDMMAIYETKENEFRIDPLNRGQWSGVVFYYPEEIISPGEGVYFTFKYLGTKEAFTLGFDNIKKNGERYLYQEPGFHSVAMQMIGTELSAHIVQNKFEGVGYFKGNLKLEEGTWYCIVLAYDREENYIIKIWEPSDPENQLVYVRNWPDFPRAYYFISWINATRDLWLDDFTIFQFDSIVQ